MIDSLTAERKNRTLVLRFGSVGVKPLDLQLQIQRREEPLNLNKWKQRHPFLHSASQMLTQASHLDPPQKLIGAPVDPM